VAAKELGYRRNISAVNFRTKQTMAIGVFHGAGRAMPSFEGGSNYFGALMDGFVAGAFANDYAVTLCPKLLGQSPDDAMSDGRFDGLVLYCTDVTEANALMLQRCTVPLVLVHTKASEFGCSVPSVLCDNYQGIGLAIDHLVSLGHRRIVFAQEPWFLSTEIRDRHDAFLKIAGDHGLPVTEKDIVTAEPLDDNFGELFSGKYSAIVACHDALAGRILASAFRFGVAIPDELSLVGFDSTTFCNELRPALTSVSQPLQQMGASAIELLVAFIRGEIQCPAELTFPCGLDIRGSTKSIEALVKS
jgi:LacI family transcriptional regulator